MQKIDQLSVEIRILNMQGLAEDKSQIFLHSLYAEDWKFVPPVMKKSKMQSWNNLGINCLQLLASKQSVLANHPASQRQKSNIVRSIKDQNNVFLSNEGTFWQMGSLLQRSSETSHLPRRTYRRCICGRKILSLQLKSSQLSKHWRLERLQVVMKCDLKWSKPWIETELIDWIAQVKWPGVLEGHRKIWCSGRSPKRLARMSDHPYTQVERRDGMQQLPEHLFL